MKLLSFVVYTQQLTEMRKFYEALGVTFVEEQHGNGPEHLSCHIGDVFIEFYPFEGGSKSKYRFEFGTEEITTVLRRLVIGALVRGQQPQDFRKRGLHLIDPDGNTVIVTSIADKT